MNGFVLYSQGASFPKEDLTNKQFGSWTVKEFYGRNKHRQALWLCECGVCGAIKPVVQNDLKSARSTQCESCANKERRWM